LSHTPARDHDSVFKWIWSNQPLDAGEDDWIFHADDFVSLVPPRGNRFESFILSHLDGWPNSWFKVRIPTPFQPSTPSLHNHTHLLQQNRNLTNLKPPTENIPNQQTTLPNPRLSRKILLQSPHQHSRATHRCVLRSNHPLHSCHSLFLDVNE
jgi:hypothetical protein